MLAALLEALFQGFKIDLAQIHRLAGFPDLIALGRNGSIEHGIDLVHDGRDVGWLAERTDLLGDDGDALAVGTKFIDRGIRQNGMEEALHAVG